MNSIGRDLRMFKKHALPSISSEYEEPPSEKGKKNFLKE